MFKKLFFILTVSCLFAACASNEKAGPRFVVVSDTHLGSERGDGAVVKVSRTLKNLLGKQPLPDAVFVVGDLTDRGTPEQYDQLLEIFSDKSLVPEGVAVYFMGGFNHDKSRPDNTLETYREKIKQPLNQYIEIKGYPFITLTEGGAGNSKSAVVNDINEDAKKFLDGKLAYAAGKFPGKPVFVFVHVPPLNTCYGSREEDGWGTDLFLSVLEKYPQVIIFSGHSHFPLGDPRSVHQGKFTSVNDGSVNYSEVEPGIVSEGIHPVNFENINEGLIVSILPDGSVEMERWDTYRNEEILPRWTVEAPHDGSRFVYKNRNGLPAPEFSAGSVPLVNVVSPDSCTVTFPQATDNEVVHHYRVEILDGGQSAASCNRFSQFYLNSDMPGELTVGFPALPAGKPLTARVTALDSYNNMSAAIESEPFVFKK